LSQPAPEEVATPEASPVETPTPEPVAEPTTEENSEVEGDVKKGVDNKAVIDKLQKDLERIQAMESELTEREDIGSEDWDTFAGELDERKARFFDSVLAEAKSQGVDTSKWYNEDGERVIGDEEALSAISGELVAGSTERKAQTAEQHQQPPATSQQPTAISPSTSRQQGQPVTNTIHDLMEGEANESGQQPKQQGQQSTDTPSGQSSVGSGVHEETGTGTGAISEWWETEENGNKILTSRDGKVKRNRVQRGVAFFIRLYEHGGDSGRGVTIHTSTGTETVANPFIYEPSQNIPTTKKDLINSLKYFDSDTATDPFVMSAEG